MLVLSTESVHGWSKLHAKGARYRLCSERWRESYFVYKRFSSTQFVAGFILACVVLCQASGHGAHTTQAGSLCPQSGCPYDLKLSFALTFHNHSISQGQVSALFWQGYAHDSRARLWRKRAGVYLKIFAGHDHFVISAHFAHQSLVVRP